MVYILVCMTGLGVGLFYFFFLFLFLDTIENSGYIHLGKR